MKSSLRSYGWSKYFESRFMALGRHDLLPGRVVQSQRGHLKIRTAVAVVDARAAGRHFHAAGEGGLLPVVGDWVALRRPAGSDAAVVEEILERRSTLSRKVAGTRAVEQVVAANVDLVLLVMGLDGDYNLRRLERLLVMAEESGARAAVALNKVDVCGDLDARLDEARAICSGRSIVAISALRGEVAALELLLEPGDTVALVGSSGAGKSTLINRLRGSDELCTRAVREHDSRGRHTTSHRELFRLPNGALVIDNPGIREIQHWQSERALARVFDEIEQLATGCRFADCTHDTEPGCAVRAAIDAGRLDRSRLDNLRRLEAEATALERRKDVRAQREHERKLHKYYRSVLKEKKNRRI
jgi:ribosome biogenesis GTPase